MINITEKAYEKMIKHGTNYIFGLKSGGCAGFSYDFHPEENINDMSDFDLFKIKSLNLYVPKEQLLYLFGTEIDYEDSFLESKIVFNNPNVSAGCGCGESVNILFNIR